MRTISTPSKRSTPARKTAKTITSKTAKTVTPSKTKTAKTVKALYPVSGLTKNSSANLWVVFPAGSTSKGLVYSSTLSRDTVRNAAGKTLGIHMNETRSRRVKSFRKISK